jgi:hypothetical protein
MDGLETLKISFQRSAGRRAAQHKKLGSDVVSLPQ